MLDHGFAIAFHVAPQGGGEHVAVGLGSVMDVGGHDYAELRDDCCVDIPKGSYKLNCEPVAGHRVELGVEGAVSLEKRFAVGGLVDHLVNEQRQLSRIFFDCTVDNDFSKSQIQGEAHLAFGLRVLTTHVNYFNRVRDGMGTIEVAHPSQR